MNILLIRLRLIGDVVFTTPLISAVRTRFPDAHVSYLVERSAAPVVRSNPHLSEVIEVEHRRGWARVVDDWRLGRQLRARRFDLVLDLHGGPRSAWLTWASRARTRVGYDVPGRAWMYTRVVHRPRVIRPRHSVENQWDLLLAAANGFPGVPDRTAHRTEMPVTPDARRSVDAWLDTRRVPHAAQVIVVHASAGNPFRRWPERAFAELVGKLAESDGKRWIILTAGPSDRDAVARILSQARADVGASAGRIVDGEGLNLAELRALVDRAALFIGGDSGPMHIASTSDVPMVTLYGPTQPVRSGPWRPPTRPALAVDAGSLPCRPCDQRHCAPGDFRCLTQVPSSAVMQAALRALETVQ